MFLAHSCYCCKLVPRRKTWENWAIFRIAYLANYVLIQFSSNLVCKGMYTKGIKYANLIEIDLVVIEIWGIENDDLAVPVNKTLVCRMSFLAADTRLCVLIYPQTMLFTSETSTYQITHLCYFLYLCRLWRHKCLTEFLHH